ncbi:hypothetical protein [Aureimonas sp. N4]|uniref:hypothetical protein n=1 Tax=Aureimonas sp. N4 TaxID=1638165 RepID=UPI0007834906|nr:hypothetical protein [Aureimonas sp. N4]
MPLQNRVTPFGEIVADPARGLFMGNRGILHDETRQLGRSRWKHPNWIICRLDYRGTKRPLMSPGAYTELFFLDEATALAAGHRPCALCRPDAFRQFVAAWGKGHGGEPPSAKAMDAALHAARVTRGRQQVRTRAARATLPDGVMIEQSGAPWLIWQGRRHLWRFEGYGDSAPLDEGEVTVLTPAPTLAVLHHGYAPVLHPTLRA